MTPRYSLWKRLGPRFRRDLKVFFTEPGFLLEYFAFRSASRKQGRSMEVSFRGWLPMIEDRTVSTPVEPHYTYFPSWAARILAANKPQRHVDISSYLPFSTLVSSFIPIDFYDYRPADIKLDSLTMGRCDLMKLDFPDNSIPSLSCMHVVEHIGLGRYGDKMDPVGDITAMSELKRVLAPGGNLLFVVPVGRPRVQFNAHRIYSHAEILQRFEGLTLKDFTLIPDNAHEVGMLPGATEEVCNQQRWGCGCYWFQKSAS